MHSARLSSLFSSIWKRHARAKVSNIKVKVSAQLSLISQKECSYARKEKPLETKVLINRFLVNSPLTL